ncbi:MAG: T9SS type A sorting domain-containing protein, partial [Bacteroidota bacterium]
FPGESDTLNWGAGCQPPNGQKNWTEKTAENEPGDRRGLGSVGPFTFYPGEMKELDLVFVFARDYTSPDTLASITKMMQMIDVVRNAFITNKLPSGGSFTMIPEQPAQTPLTCNVFPNPATSRIFIVFDTPLKEKTILQLINDQGKVILSCQVNAGITGTHLDLGDMTVGLYLMIIRSSHTITTKKLSFIR